MIVEDAYILNFLLGGKCECVIENEKTERSFRYKIMKSDNASLFFVHLFGDAGYKYAGFIKLVGDKYVFATGKNGALTVEDVEVKALLYVLNKSGKLPSGVNVRHIGRCSRCSRKLTDALSIARGLGPECYKSVGV